jgi:hypothetical protein
MFEHKSPKETNKRREAEKTGFEPRVCRADRPHCAGKIHVSVRRNLQRDHWIQAKHVENLPPRSSNLVQNKPAQRNLKDLTA